MWRDSALFRRLRTPQHGGACASCAFYNTCKGGCMAAKFFTGLPLDGPDPECVQGYGEERLALRPSGTAHLPKPSGDHSHRTSPRPVDLVLTRRPPVGDCAEDPLAGLEPTLLGKGGTHA